MNGPFIISISIDRELYAFQANIAILCLIQIEAMNCSFIIQHFNWYKHKIEKGFY
jgi:hypothetical protein